MGQERQGISQRLRACVAVLAVLGALGCINISSAAAVPANFWGVVPQATPTVEQFQQLKRGGADSIRIPIGWASTQPVADGPFDWSGSDAVIRGAASAGIDVLPYVSGAPTWAVRADTRYGSPESLPVRTGAQRARWTNFVREAVLRYGPTGTFWAENPGVPRRPIRTWQIWNEENFMYFVAKPNPREYGKLVKISYSAIKGVDPGAQIILGGLFSKPRQAIFKRKPPLAYFATDFLDQLYRTTPGIRTKFQGIALHPYTSEYQDLTLDIEEVRTILKKNHDASKGLWITEIGWSSQTPSAGNSFAKGRTGQATQLKGAFRLLKAQQRKWQVKRLYWFSVDDQEHVCNFCNGSGLFGLGFVPKPSWFAFAKIAGGNPR